MDNNSGEPLVNIILRWLKFLILAVLTIAALVICFNPAQFYMCHQQREQYLFIAHIFSTVALILSIIFDIIDEEKNTSK